MGANPAFPRHSGRGTVITSAAATLIALGILIGITMLFQSRGKPMAELAAAERACAGQTYVSDRERCMREWVAAAHGDRLRRPAIGSPIADVRGPMQSKTLQFVPELSCAYVSRVAAP